MEKGGTADLAVQVSGGPLSPGEVGTAGPLEALLKQRREEHVESGGMSLRGCLQGPGMSGWGVAVEKGRADSSHW